jgi:hypothetical protein
MVELLCANMQRDELAAVNASIDGEGVSQEAREAVLKVRQPPASCRVLHQGSFAPLCE